MMDNQFKEQIATLRKNREDITNSFKTIDALEDVTEENDFHLADLPYSSMTKVKAQDMWKSTSA